MQDYEWLCQGREVFTALWNAMQFSNLQGYYKQPLKVKATSLELVRTTQKFLGRTVMKATHYLPY